MSLQTNAMSVVGYHKDEGLTARNSTRVVSMKLVDSDTHNELIKRIAKYKDRKAFAALFEHFAPRMKAFAIKAGLNNHAAEEVMQEAMIAVWRRADSFDATKASASTWLFTIVRNKRIDYLRRENKPELKAEDFAHVDRLAEESDAIVSKKQDAHEVNVSVSDLPEDQQTVIQKAFYEDKSHAQVAEELGIPLGTVKSRIRLALIRLKGSMDSKLVKG